MTSVPEATVAMAVATTAISTVDTTAAGVAAGPGRGGLPGGVNPLDFLYKLAMQRNMKPPEFKQVTEQGPAHMKTFVWHCSFNQMVAQGTGRSKKEAKIAAAKSIRDSIDYEKLPPAPTYSAVKRKVSANPNAAKKRRSFLPLNFSSIYGEFDEEEEGKNAEEEDADMSGPPSRETFMHPQFGGFHDDSNSLTFDQANVYDRERALLIGECQSRMARGYCSRLSKLDRHVIRKHKEIYPQDGELTAILSLVTRTEENLKKLAEKLNIDEKRISGMVRIGDLSKGLLLSQDKTVDLVLICKKWPTVDLLNDIHQNLECEIDNQTLVVKEDQFQVNVWLTSHDQMGEEDPSKLEGVGCIEALRELRHSRWFAVTAANLPSCVECIRVVKDLAVRDKAWSALDKWAIEVLVERSLFSAWLPLNPAASLMRVMEIVSSGLFLKDGPGLLDPCEKDPKDVAEHLTNQQREDLTRSAQIFLRFMHFRQIYKVLGLESDDLFDLESNQNGEEKPTG